MRVGAEDSQNLLEGQLLDQGLDGIGLVAEEDLGDQEGSSQEASEENRAVVQVGDLADQVEDNQHLGDPLVKGLIHLEEVFLEVLEGHL